MLRLLSTLAQWVFQNTSFHSVHCVPRAHVNWEHDRTWLFDVALPPMSAGTEGTDLSLTPNFQDMWCRPLLGHEPLYLTCFAYNLFLLWVIPLMTSSLVTYSPSDLFPLADWELSASWIHVWFICVSLQTLHNATQKYINTWLRGCPCL